MNTLQRLHAEFDQSPWVDSIDRALIDSGGLADLVANGIRGLTSNPTIFAKAVAAGHYDKLIASMQAAGADARDIYQAIAVGDIGDAADALRGVYDTADGADGFVSIEVEPDLAGDTDGTTTRARELWGLVDRPNVFIKIPATPAGLPAIEAVLAEGINVNVTLLFSVEVYRAVAAAHLAGLRRRLADGGDIRRLASVASFFVSRVDTKVDKALDAAGPSALRGTAAIANARLAYAAFGEIYGGTGFSELAASGARVQRCLWASTSTKDPTYRDVRYVEELIGPATVNTMPRETIVAMLDHGELARTLDRDPAADRAARGAIETAGISMDTVTDELLDEGVRAFAASFEELLATIEQARSSMARA